MTLRRVQDFVTFRLFPSFHFRLLSGVVPSKVMESHEVNIPEHLNTHDKLSKLEVIDEDRVLETSSTVPSTSVTFESLKDAFPARCSGGVTFPDSSFSTVAPSNAALATTTATIVPNVVRNQLVVHENGKTQLNPTAPFINMPLSRSSISEQTLAQQSVYAPAQSIGILNRMSRLISMISSPSSHSAITSPSVHSIDMLPCSESAQSLTTDQVLVGGHPARGRLSMPTGIKVIYGRETITRLKADPKFNPKKIHSAISLRRSVSSENGSLSMPCTECPYCKRSTPATGASNDEPCLCRVCAILRDVPARDEEPNCIVDNQQCSLIETIKPGDSQPHHELTRRSSEIGIFCEHCALNGSPLPDGRCCRLLSAHVTHGIDQLSSSNSYDSLCSEKDSNGSKCGDEASSSGDSLCRICHCTSTADSSDTLISPCRCSGSLQFVHMSCLLHWLEISSRKLRRPAICELCLYKYRRKRILKYHDITLPECSRRDFGYQTVFLGAILLMFLSAVFTIICFQLEKNLGIVGTGKTDETTPGTDAQHIENVLSTVTLVSGILFFFSFFVAMYAHIKSGVNFFNYVSLCWAINHEWMIEEYKVSRDSHYINKLQEVRKKLHEKQQKLRNQTGNDTHEIEPLRHSDMVAIEISDG
uniref:RING-CH-type domain-containing protein n=1 Tax=Steinernema glaseri TaxID=37863 RepID=A0A1I8A9G7_9BILA